MSAPADRPRRRLAVDIGGTFTDVALDVGDRLITTKVLTTPRDPSRGFLEGVDKALLEAGLAVGDLDLIVHGTTLATNALIERRGAKTALLTTEGHRDAIEMAHENRFEQYDISIDRPAPLTPRYLRLPIRERMDRHGRPLVALDEASVVEAIERLGAEGVESVAVGFLHSYANPAHERRVAEIISEAAPHLWVTTSSAVCPEIREYERFSTACANAYVRPLMARYLTSLREALEARGADCPLLMMTSGGGLTSLDAAMQFPVRLIESGPAGGAILAAHAARIGNERSVISYDMGGTTAKLCLIDDYEAQTSRAFEVDRAYRFKKGSGLPVRIPVIEMVEIGAGGGSIAHVDRLGRVQTGPQSAGSEPGPAIYGRGGDQATVTDADFALGKIEPSRFAGGAFQLDEAAAATALEASVAAALSISVDAAAYAVTEIVDENMAAAARAHAVEWGKDVRVRTMIAFGGAAPLHAARLAEKLGITRILVPANAGVGSAVGFLLAPIAYEVVRSAPMSLSSFDADGVGSLLDEMREEALCVVAPALGDRPIEESRTAYMRYRGQGHEIAVTAPAGRYDSDTPAKIETAFLDAYRRLYGRDIPGVEIEILSWSLGLSGGDEPTLAASCENASSPRITEQPAPIGERMIFDAHLQDRIAAPIFEREQLQAGDQITGPAIIVEPQTTTIVTAAFHMSVDIRKTLVLDLKASV